MSTLEKYHVHVPEERTSIPDRPFVVWAENPFQAVSECRVFDECVLSDVNASLNKYVFICTMAEPYAVSPCDVRRVAVYRIG